MEDSRKAGHDAGRKPRAIGIILAVWTALATAPAEAQWAVADVPHTLKTVLGWTAQYRQMLDSYERQADQLRSLDRRYEQALVTGAGYEGAPGYRERFQERALEVGVVERCGPVAPAHPRGAEQHGYCADIVRTENRRFNAVVAMLGDVEARDAELRAAYAERADIRPEEEGRLASNSNRILSIQAQLQNEVRNGEALLIAYDAALGALREQHVRAADDALSGSAGPTLVQGLALKAALQVARGRER